jgi:hypothetical protein
LLSFHVFKVAQLVTFLQQSTNSSVQTTAPVQPPSVATSQASPHHQSITFEPRSTPTNLTTFQANVPLATFQASDKSSISPASSSLGYAKDSSPLGSSLGANNCEKLSPNGSTIGQTTPLVYGNQKRGGMRMTSDLHLQEIQTIAFNSRSYNGGTVSLESNSGIAVLHNECEMSDGLNRDLNPQWKFQSSPVEAANYTVLSEWSPARDYLIDDFTILGFRPQDEITTEL